MRDGLLCCKSVGLAKHLLRQGATGPHPLHDGISHATALLQLRILPDCRQHACFSGHLHEHRAQNLRRTAGSMHVWMYVTCTSQQLTARQSCIRISCHTLQGRRHSAPSSSRASKFCAICWLSLRRARVHAYFSVSSSSRSRQLRAVSSSNRNSPQVSFSGRICGRKRSCEKTGWVWQGKWLMKASQISWGRSPHQDCAKTSGLRDLGQPAMAHEQQHVSIVMLGLSAGCVAEPGRLPGLNPASKARPRTGYHGSGGAGSPRSSCSVSVGASHCASQAAEQHRLSLCI